MAVTLVSLLLFGAVIIGMAAYGYKISAKTAEDYMLGGRTIGVVVMFFFVLFAISSAWTFYGFPGVLYMDGPGYVAFIWGSVLGFAGLYMFLGPRLWAISRINRFLSPVEVLSERYESKALRMVLSISILAFVVPYIGIQPLGVGAGFRALTGLPAIYGAIYTVVLLVALVLLGGMRIVAWVNIFLGVIYIIALLGSLVWVVIAAPELSGGGLVEAASILERNSPGLLTNPGPYEAFTPVLFAGTFVVGMLAFSWPHVVIGTMTARDKSLFKWFPLLIFVFGGLFFYIIPFLWGSLVAPAIIPLAELETMAAEAGIPVQEEADRVVQTIIQRVLPSWAGVFVLMGVVAAAVSTAAVQLMTSSVIVARDVVQGLFKPDASDRQVSTYARWSVVVIVLLSLSFSIWNQGAMALYLTDVSVPGFAQWAPALVGGLFWRRATRQGAVAATATGVIYLVLGLLVTVDGSRILLLDLHPVIPTIIVNLIVFIVVSLMTPRPSDAVISQYFDEPDEYLKAEV